MLHTAGITSGLFSSLVVLVVYDVIIDNGCSILLEINNLWSRSEEDCSNNSTLSEVSATSSVISHFTAASKVVVTDETVDSNLTLESLFSSGSWQWFLCFCKTSCLTNNPSLISLLEVPKCWAMWSFNWYLFLKIFWQNWHVYIWNPLYSLNLSLFWLT